MRAVLGRNVLINMGTVAASLAASLATVPFILGKVGTDGYGTWVIGFTFVTYLMIADNGFGPAIQRWVGLATGAGQAFASRRVLWSALGGYTVIGAAAAMLVIAGAPWWVDVFLDDGSPQEADALRMFELVGIALLFTLWVAALQNVLQGLGRFPAMAISSILGSLAYLAGVFVLLGDGMGLVGLGWALIAQQLVVGLVRLIALRDLLLAGRPRLLRWVDAKEITVFASKLQLSAFAGLLNSQSDKVVVGVVSPARTTGEMGIASQLTDAGRLVATAALTPVFSALAITRGSGDDARLRDQFAWMHRTWIFAIGGGTIVALGALEPLLSSWIGSGHGEAVTLGLVLVAANGFSLVNGVAMAYLRAVGRPGTEARLGPLVLVLNLVFTIPFGIAFGAHGVVAGTLAAYLVGVAWFMRAFHRLAPEVDRVRLIELVRPATLALIAGGIALAVGFVVDSALPTGVGLLPVMAVAGIAYLGYLSAATRNPPTPAGIRRLVAGMRGSEA